MGLKFPKLRACDFFPISFLRAILSRRAPLLALRTKVCGHRRYCDNRGREIGTAKPAAQSHRGRSHVLESSFRDEPRARRRAIRSIYSTRENSFMAVIDQMITDTYAIYNADCVETMKTLPDESIHLSCYSPPFGGLYNYSSSERDLSNCTDYAEFFEHYKFVVEEIARLTLPGRMTAVHCMDVPSGNSGTDYLLDFPGDIIKLHAECGFRYIARYAIWKEPLAVRNRTMAKNLAHKTIVDDSSRCSVASADYLLVFRRKGDNPIPI